MSYEDDDVDFSGPTHGLAAVPFGSTRPTSASITSMTKQQSSVANQSATNAVAGLQAILAQAKPLVAMAVDAFKFVGDQYQSQGKVGLSLLAAAASRQYFIIMYKQGAKGEKVPLTVTNITDRFKFIVRSDNYGSFYDDTGCNWAARFENADGLASFCLQLVVARTMSNPKQQIVMQDVLLGDGNETIADGWRAECNYTSYSLTTNGVLTQTGSFQKQKMKATANKAGHGQLLVGMGAPGGRRIGVLIQTDGSFVAYDITVLRARQPSPQNNPAPDAVSSNSELDSSGAGSGRVGLLSRMARLGQHVMPGPEPAASMPAEEPDYSDSESVSVPSGSPSKRRGPRQQAEIPQQSQPFVPTRSHVNAVSSTPGVAMMVGQTGVPIPTLVQTPQNVVAQRQIAVYQSPVYTNQPQMLQSEVVTPTQSVASESQQRPEWSVLFMETRQNSTEMRVLLSKIQDKLDTLGQRLDVHNQQQAFSVASADVAGGTLDGRAVMSALQRMVAEEERLRDELKARQDKIEQLNLRVSELLTDKQKLIEQSNRALSDRSDVFSTTAAQSAGRVLQLEEEKVNLAQRVSTLTSEVSDLHLSVAEKRRTELDLRNELTALKETLSEATKSTEESGAKFKQMEAAAQASKDAETLAVAELQTEKRRVAVLTSELADTKKQLDNANVALYAKDSALTDTLSKASEEQSSSAAKVRSLQEEINRLHQDIQSARSNTERLTEQLMAKMSENQSLIADRDRLAGELRSKASEGGSLSTKIAETTHALDDAKQLIARLRSETDSLRETYEQKLVDWERRFVEEQERHRSQPSSTPSAPLENVDALITQQVKSIMNQVYQSARSAIVNEQQYLGQDVLKTLLGVIKQTTLTFLGAAKPKTENAYSVVTVQSESSKLPEVVHPPVKIVDAERDVESRVGNAPHEDDNATEPVNEAKPVHIEASYDLQQDATDAENDSAAAIPTQPSEESEKPSVESEIVQEHVDPVVPDNAPGNILYTEELDSTVSTEVEEKPSIESEIVPEHVDPDVPDNAPGNIPYTQELDSTVSTEVDEENGPSADKADDFQFPSENSAADETLDVSDYSGGVAPVVVTKEGEGESPIVPVHCDHVVPPNDSVEPVDGAQPGTEDSLIANESQTFFDPLSIPEAEVPTGSTEADTHAAETAEDIGTEINEVVSQVPSNDVTSAVSIDNNSPIVDNSNDHVLENSGEEKIADPLLSNTSVKEINAEPVAADTVGRSEETEDAETKNPDSVVTPDRTAKLFQGDDSDSDVEDLFGSKPPPAPVETSPPSTDGIKAAAGSDNNLSLFDQSKAESDESELEHSKQQPPPPPVPQTRGGALFGDDDDDDDDDWFGGTSK